MVYVQLPEKTNPYLMLRDMTLHPTNLNDRYHICRSQC